MYSIYIACERVYLLRVQPVGQSLGIRPDDGRRLFLRVTITAADAAAAARLLFRPGLSGRGDGHSIAFDGRRRGGGRTGWKFFVSASRVLDL